MRESSRAPAYLFWVEDVVVFLYLISLSRREMSIMEIGSLTPFRQSLGLCAFASDGPEVSEGDSPWRGPSLHCRRAVGETKSTRYQGIRRSKRFSNVTNDVGNDLQVVPLVAGALPYAAFH